MQRGKHQNLPLKLVASTDVIEVPSVSVDDPLEASPTGEGRLAEAGLILTMREVRWWSSLVGEKTGKGHNIFLCKEKTAELLQSCQMYCGEKKQFLKDLALSENLMDYSEEGEYRNSSTSSCSDLFSTSQGKLFSLDKGC